MKRGFEGIAADAPIIARLPGNQPLSRVCGRLRNADIVCDPPFCREHGRSSRVRWFVGRGTGYWQNWAQQSAVSGQKSAISRPSPQHHAKLP